ncbi:hypothetical protein APS67_006727 [Streptomyces sp. AVP053U2]|nr:hypothetical protein APS67_006727 [Streptomyces sp. AVP053U2]
MPRSRVTATRDSGPTPRSVRWCASRSERASSSAYEISAPSATTATASGARSACAANRSTTVAGATSAVVPAQSASSRRRSSASRTSTDAIGVRGAAASVRRTVAKRPASRWTLSASNRSAAATTTPRSPAGRPSASKDSATFTSRSNLATGAPVGTVSVPRPGRSRTASALFCTVSATWKSGWRARERAGASSSTSRSKGTSWWARADRPLSRTRASRSAKAGLPERSVRRTSVLTKKPTRSSRASSVRPAFTEPMTTSLPVPSRDSRTARADCSTIDRVAPSARATSVRRWCTSAGMSSGAPWPRLPRTAGRGWS